MTFLIRVPATTANLGPGFDCLGLALDIWNDLEVSVTGDKLQIELQGRNADFLPVTEENAICQSMLAYAKRRKKPLPNGLHLLCINRIPLGSGLGSSSAAAVAGILAATAILDIPQDIEDQLDCAEQIEGHPDNVAPCLFGGLVASTVDHGKVFARKLPISDFSLVIVHPNFIFPTRIARAALPKQVSHRDAVQNSSRVLLLSEALRTSDHDLLRIAMQDRLHEPYRLPLIPGASAAIAAGKNVGAIAVVLSGAGPSLLAFSPSCEANPAIATAIQEVFTQAGLASEVFFPKISQFGATITSI
jgi:homoserine kinase